MTANVDLPPAAPPPATQFTVKDFDSGQDVRWCPGCGDYSILAGVKKTLAALPVPPWMYCFISGIGCSSRFPYYMGTYGMHSIHGRAAAVATGFRAARPDIQTWVVTGDGDGMSIGGNHTMHALRRNVGIKMLLFNNRIYGLTKGQYSPTSELGKKTKSSPMGTVDNPIEPIPFALACGATFVARTFDTHIKHMTDILTTAHGHDGISFIEIYQNCNIFNDGAFDMFTDRKVRSEKMIELEHGKPMIFGEKRDKGIVMGKDFRPQVVTLGENGMTEANLLVHDENAPEAIATMLARMSYPEFPVPIGTFRRRSAPVFEKLLNAQVDEAKKKRPVDIQALVTSRETWTVHPENGAH